MCGGCTHAERAVMAPQGSGRRSWVVDVHRVASALPMRQPQQQRVQAFVELLHGKTSSVTSSSSRRKFEHKGFQKSGLKECEVLQLI